MSCCLIHHIEGIEDDLDKAFGKSKTEDFKKRREILCKWIGKFFNKELSMKNEDADKYESKARELLKESIVYEGDLGGGEFNSTKLIYSLAAALRETAEPLEKELERCMSIHHVDDMEKIKALEERIRELENELQNWKCACHKTASEHDDVANKRIHELETLIKYFADGNARELDEVETRAKQALSKSRQEKK